MTRRRSADLAPIDEARSLPGGDRASEMQLCGREDGSYAVAWTRSAPLDRPVPHEYANLADAVVTLFDASGAATTAARVHSVRAGSQSLVGLQCLDDGGVAVLWWDECIGTRTLAGGGSERFVPRACDASPNATLRWRRLAADGSPASPRRVSFSWREKPSRFLAMSGGASALFTTDRFFVVDETGRLVEHYAMPQAGTQGSYLDGDCGTGDRTCVLTTNRDGPKPDGFGDFRAAGFDPFTKSITDSVVLKPYRTSSYGDDWITNFADDNDVACDENGDCLAIWLQWRVVYPIHGEGRERYLGLRGRSFHARTLETGDPVVLMGASNRARRPSVIRVGDDRFVVAAGSGGGLTLSVFELLPGPAPRIP